MQEAAIVIAILALATLSARELVRATSDARRKARMLDEALTDLSRCLAITERALADENVPAVIKAVLYNQAAALAEPTVGRARVAAFVGSTRPDDGPDPDDPVDQALDRLAARDASLAFDCRAALTQGLMALLLLHADEVAVDRVTRDVVRRRHGLPARLDLLFGGIGPGLGGAGSGSGGPSPVPV
ncbi:hypothetical protein VQ02_03705 [Methylobacterium variabile]|jgi:hypothetical protein|uniref:Uncharacterized protein n=1 Tax=Methylobacterium variabile TaxID=298794 RepID=A0A0J6T9G8_9HYPH|nr:hypothetical protein [Methylobacterium variabile]KMO42218.1 hypothetical protein VQ02_03705 [Methylobacterium variabile]